VSVLLRKSLRDLRSYRGQAISIALLVAVVTLLVTGGIRARGMLSESRDGWYERLSFADLELFFQPTHRGLADMALKVEGVLAAEERLLAEGLVTAEDLHPLPALLQVLPAAAPPRLNQLHLLEGHYPMPGEKAVVIDRSLQAAHGLRLGTLLTVRMDEEERTLPIVGIAFSPEHVLHPINPEYTMPLAGTVAVIGVSEAAVEGIKRSDRVDSLLLRLKPGVDEARLRLALQEALPVSIAEFRARADRPGHAFTEQILATYDIYMPTTAFVIVLIALALLVLTLVRIVQRQRVSMGTLVTLGHGPLSIASSFLAIALLPTLAGTLLGSAVSGPFARMLFSSYARKVGYAPLLDPGAGAAAWLTALCCLLTALLACFVPALILAQHRPAALLARGAWKGALEPQGGLVHLAARLRDVLRVPLPVVVGLTHVSRRRGSTAAAVLGLGAIFAVVLAFLLVHITHRREIGASVSRLGLDATVHFTEPVDDEAIAALGRQAEGEAEALLSRRALLELGERTLYRRLLCVRPGRWMEKLRVASGRKLRSDDEPGILVDQYLAGTCGVDVGDEIVCYPSKDAPEGMSLRIVGVLEGVGLGLAVLPLETGRQLFSLPGLATCAHVASNLPAVELEKRLWQAPEVEAVFSLERAGVQVRAIFEGSTIVLVLALLMAILVAVLFLGVLAALDATERAPDFAILTALGWRQRSIVSLCLTEVMTRGVLALCLAVPLAPLLAGWLLDRIAAANHYRMQLDTPLWLFAAVVSTALLLMPLGALPALRAAQRVTPARALRLLATE